MVEIVAEEIATAAAVTEAEETAAVAAVLVAVLVAVPPAAPRRISDRMAIAAPALGRRWGGCEDSDGGCRWSGLGPRAAVIHRRKPSPKPRGGRLLLKAWTRLSSLYHCHRVRVVLHLTLVVGKDWLRNARFGERPRNL